VAEYKQNTRFLSALILGVTLGSGIFGAGYYIGKAVLLSRQASRIVTVKGLAQRDVKADLAVYEIDYREIGGDLTELHSRLERDQLIVMAFLKDHGFTDAEFGPTPIKLEDKVANAYQNGAGLIPNQRYVLTGGMRVRSTKVDAIQQINQLAGTLLQQNVPLTLDGSGLGYNPSYYFTQLDQIRPQMLAEATHSARLVAEQFAKDAETELNGIQRASQGIFQVMGRDSSAESSGDGGMNAIDKKVRLVTTLDYRLK
jgi:hypothetical protein